MIMSHATAKQVSFARRLRSELNPLITAKCIREGMITQEQADAANAEPVNVADVEFMTIAQASNLIDRLITSIRECKKELAITNVPAPRNDAPAATKEVTITKPGVFRKDGDVYLVKPNREKTRVYAKRLVKSADRLTESGDTVKFEFEYAPGAIFNLVESDRVALDDEEIRKITTKYGRCICCNKALKAAKSVERMIGPVCAGYFA